MQDIQNCCILKHENKLYVVYNEREKGVVIRKFDGRRWGSADIIVKASHGEFMVNACVNKTIFVFCQDNSGNITLYKNDGGKWRSSTLLDSPSNTLYNLCFHALASENKTFTLYNTPSNITAGLVRYKIVLQELASGRWSERFEVDEALDANPVFNVIRVTPSHFALCYTRLEEGGHSFGYKEYRPPNVWSAFKPLLKTAYPISEKSVTATDNGIHSALVLKGARASQLVYVNKLGEKPCSPVTLFESETLEKAALFLHSGNIYIVFSAGLHGFYSTVSGNDGRTFSRPARLRPSSENIIKAGFASDVPLEDGVHIGDLLTDARNPGAALFLEEIYKGFYPSEEQEGVTVAKTPSTSSQTHGDGLGSAQRELDRLTSLLTAREREINSLATDLDNAYRELSDKERRIEELNTILSRQSEGEIDITSGKLRAENTEKTKTITSLQNRLIELQSENALLSAALEAARAEQEAETEAKAEANAEVQTSGGDESDYADTKDIIDNNLLIFSVNDDTDGAESTEFTDKVADSTFHDNS